jgi:acyl-CoA synthetase (AMP-forming)/AMP-acid ligase II
MFIAPTVGTITDALTGRTWDAAALEGEVRSRMAGYRAHGVRRGDRVMLGFGNRLEFFADLTALWRLGVCVIPLDARFTVFEVETLVRAAKARAFVSCGAVDGTINARLAAIGTSVLDSLALATTAHDAESGLPQFSLEDDALILFTSGTTGNPKGVVHTHRTLRARWLALRDHLGIEAYARTLCLLPTHFGHGLICNALFPWLSGQSLFILPPFTPDVLMRLGAILDEHRITFMSSVPAVWRMALKASRPPAAGTLQRVFVGSAPLSAHLWREIRAWSGAREVANAYGITETGSWVAGTTIPNVEPEDGLVGLPWGAAVAITRSGEIDAPPGVGELCPPGESGFVWLNTPALMKGYMDRDDLTEQCVRGGWFLTGDLGLISDRGWLYLRGRVRDEINKGGAKVYPADVEAIAEQVPGVLDVCCFAVEDPNYGQNVGLALVLADGGSPRIRELHTWLRSHLAEHQLPVRWFILDEIPRTSRGKINRDHIAAACKSMAPVDLRLHLRD